MDKKLYRLSALGKMLNIPRTTLLEAIKRGELEHYTTGCGLPLATLADAKKWIAKDRKLGRPPTYK